MTENLTPTLAFRPVDLDAHLDVCQRFRSVWSVVDLKAAIRQFIEAHNAHSAKPFSGTQRLRTHH